MNYTYGVLLLHILIKIFLGNQSLQNLFLLSIICFTPLRITLIELSLHFLNSNRGIRYHLDSIVARINVARVLRFSL